MAFTFLRPFAFLLTALLLAAPSFWGCARNASNASGAERADARPPLSFSLVGLKTIGPGDPAAAPLLRQADRDLTMAPETVTAKTAWPPGADKRDYVSLSVYYWPDPAKPDGVPYVARDGFINPEREDGSRYDALRLDKTTDAVTRLGLAWGVTGKSDYARKAEELVRVFFFDPATGMRPNLNNAQGAPGRPHKSAGGAWGRPAGIIETHRLVEMLDAVSLMEADPAWPAGSKQAMRQWCSEYLDWLLQSPMGRAEGARENNHGVWRDAQVVALALYSGRTDVARSTLEAAKAGRIGVQITPDGRMPEEEARTRSLHYFLFTLRPFMALARAGEGAGVDLAGFETVDGRSLRAAYARVLRHLVDGEPWAGKNVLGDDRQASGAAALAWGEVRYGRELGPGRAAAAARTLLGESTGARRVMTESFLRELPAK